MKILALDQFSETGGAQLGFLATLDAIEQRGWQAHAALPRGGPLIGLLRARSLPVREIPCGPYRSGTKTAADSIRFLRDLCRQMRAIRRQMREADFDLVYVNGPRLLPAIALTVPKRVPILFHAHSQIHQRSAAKLARWSLWRSKATVVGCSHSVLHPLRASVHPDKLHVIANGVPEIPFRERRFAPEQEWRIGMIGRISPEKGHAEFLQAAAMLVRGIPNVRFVICGAPLFGGPAYSDLVHNLARGLPVDFLGWREDIDNVLAGLDLLVLPSKEEGMPRVLLEAFSAGVPVIAFPAGGIPEVVKDGETGFLVPEMTPEALAARMRAIMTTGAQDLRRIAAAARQAWERSYTLRIYQSRITELMEHLVSAARAERETETLPQRT